MADIHLKSKEFPSQTMCGRKILNYNRQLKVVSEKEFYLITLNDDKDLCDNCGFVFYVQPDRKY